MKYLSIVLTAVMGLFFTQTVVAQSDSETSESKTDTVSAWFSKKQIEEKLELLAMNPPQISLSWIGFMCCFDVPVSYTCPKCGSKTLYKPPMREWLMDFGIEKFVRNENGYFEPALFFDFDSKSRAHEYVAYKIQMCQEEIQKIKGIHITLDESEFCEHCSPFIAKPTLYLLTNIEGESDTTKIPNVLYFDIRLLKGFLESNSIYDVNLTNEQSHTNYIERIKELLGIKDH